MHVCNFTLILKFRSKNNIGANKIGIVPDSHFKIFEPIVDLKLDSKDRSDVLLKSFSFDVANNLDKLLGWSFLFAPQVLNKTKPIFSKLPFCWIFVWWSGGTWSPPWPAREPYRRRRSQTAHVWLPFFEVYSLFIQLLGPKVCTRMRVQSERELNK